MKPFWSSCLALLALSTVSTLAQTVEWESRWDGGLVDADVDRVFLAAGADGTRFAVTAVRVGFESDLLTIAWNPTGTLRWARTRNCGGDDVPGGIAVSPLGNLIVACRADAQIDAVMTVAYDSSGNELWARSESDLGARWQEVRGLAIAPATGRVVVAAAAGQSTLDEARIYSYGSDGTPLWSRTLPLVPAPRAAAMDNDGNLALAGESSVFMHSGRFTTTLLASGGNDLWSAEYDGGVSTTETVHALAIDSLGHVLVTGNTRALGGPDQSLTVAYDTAGTELWATVLPSTANDVPEAIAVDSDRNVYVAGSRDEGERHGLIHSLSEAGSIRWSTIATDGPSQTSGFHALAALPGGGIVAGGWISDAVGLLRPAATRFDDASGALGWTHEEPQAGSIESLAMTDDGGVLLGAEVGETFHRDLLVDWLSSGGALLWTAKEPTVSPSDIPASGMNRPAPTALSTGYDGRVIVTGSSFDGVSPISTTVAFNAAGAKLWAARKSSALQFPITARASAVDPDNGNVYVAGDLDGPGGPAVVTTAYDRSGSELWTRTRRGDDGGPGGTCCLVLAPGGTIIVAGWVDDVDFGRAALVVAYSPDGNELWADFAGPDQFASAEATALATGAAGEIFVGGLLNGTSSDFLVWASSQDGTRLWTEVRDSGSNANDWLQAIAARPEGGVIATGAAGFGDSSDAFTVAYDSSGAESWSLLLDGGRGGNDSASTIVVGPDGRSIVGGTSYGPTFADPDLFAFAIEPGGELAWSRTKDGGHNGKDLGRALSIDTFGTIVLVGSSEGVSNTDLWAVAYSAGGSELFDYRYDNGGADSGYLAVAVPDGFVVGGASEGLGVDYFIANLVDESGLFVDGFESGGFEAWSEVTQ